MNEKSYTVTAEGRDLYYKIMHMLRDASMYYRRRDAHECLSAIIIGKKQYDMLCPIVWEHEEKYGGFSSQFPEHFEDVPLVVVQEDCVRLIPKPKMVSLYGLPSLDNYSL